jgi:A nuclease of the HNH/ENDO VII superfamily with conserved LHH
MIETEEQRRWWFATHPEYSWSRRGIRGDSGGEESDDRVDPEEVDKYVDEALKYETGPVADLLRSVKRNFGTEGYPRRTLGSEGLGWDTEAGGRLGARRGPRGPSTRRGLEITDRIPMTLSQRRSAEAIERELDRVGANPRDYRLNSFAGQHVAQRDSLFDRDQMDPEGRTNQQRIDEGLAPLDRSGEALVLHHANQRKDGPIIELTRQEHLSLRVRQEPSEIDRAEFRDFRESYWRARAAAIRSPEPELFYLR